MSELQDAVKQWDLRGLMAMSEEQMELIVEAARLVANPRVILWCHYHDQEPNGTDYCKDRWPDDGYESCEIVEKWLIEPPAALTPGDTKQEDCETCKGSGQIGVYEGPEGYEQLDVDTCPDCDGTGVAAAALTPGDTKDYPKTQGDRDWHGDE